MEDIIREMIENLSIEELDMLCTLIENHKKEKGSSNVKSNS